MHSRNKSFLAVFKYPVEQMQ